MWKPGNQEDSNEEGRKRFFFIPKVPHFCSTPWKPSSLGVASRMLSMLDLEKFRNTPLTSEPFDFLIVPEFVKPDVRAAIDKDYPDVTQPATFPLGRVSYVPPLQKPPQ